MLERSGACEAGLDAIKALVGVMKNRVGDQGPTQNPKVAAGFTYLAQFIDHDLTFDPTPFTDRERDPHAHLDFRTPRFDLDSVYGLGPDVQPFLYDRDSDPKGVRLLVGFNPEDGTADLPRNQQELALIGDPRNDENVILSQLHLLFIRFHNAVVDRLADATPPKKLFEMARTSVRRHYQWIIVNEFLPLIVGKRIAKDVLEERTYFTPEDDRPFMPTEFSGAAYRFGHSMVRAGYDLKRPPTAKEFAFEDLMGRRALTRDRVIDWERFFDLRPPTERDEHLPREVQRSLTIDTTLSKALFSLTEGEPKLARRNLVRGHNLELPSGQSMAEKLGQKALDPDELGIDDGAEHRDVLLRSTPPWYYILAEAETRAGGRQLGPVGGLIVGEVLVGLLQTDPDSYLRVTDGWKPGEPGTPEDFTMADLIEFVRAADP
jgi:hypothetical protein